MRRTIALPIYLLFATALTAADGDYHKLDVHVGGGLTVPDAKFGQYSDWGGHITAGAGYNASKHFSLLGEFSFNDLGVSSGFLQSINIPGGTTRIYSLTGNILIRPIRLGPFGLYVIGGGGWYRRTVEFTQPTTAIVPFFDPWFGFGAVAVPANQVIGSITRDAPGINGGAGFEFGVPRGLKVYAEARYHRAYTSPTNTSFQTATVGLRF
jgi:hypothetical protein